MDLSIPEFKHSASLSPKWLEDSLNKLGCKFNNKIVSFPENTASGSCYFLEISPDISAFVVDLTLKKPMRFTRMPSEEDFWVVYYDISDGFNKHFVDNVKHKIGYTSKLGFAIVDSRTKSTYVSSVGERAFSLRLYIRKSYIMGYFKNSIVEKDFKNIFDDEKRKMFYYGHIDSRSNVQLFQLKSQNMHDSNYEFLLKGITYKIFGYLLERLNADMPEAGAFLEKDLLAIMHSQEYLLSDVLKPFPGVKALSKMANMSISKFQNLYLNVFGMSPASFFKNEKLRLAKELLESGKYWLISDVAYELNYFKTSYFSLQYKKYHGHLPKEVFKSKTN